MTNSVPYIYLIEAPADDARSTAVCAFRLLSCLSERPTESGYEGEAFRRRHRAQTEFICALSDPFEKRIYTIRYLATPNPASISAGELSVVFFVACAGATPGDARSEAAEASADIFPLLGGAFPDNQWCIITDEADFLRVWQPFAVQDGHAVEIRRRHDLLRLESLRTHPSFHGNLRKQTAQVQPEDSVYFVHPFLPTPSNYGRLMRILLMQAHPTLVDITLAPTTLNAQEEEAMQGEVAKCESVGVGSQQNASLLVHAQDIYATQARALNQILIQRLHSLQDDPFLMRISIASVHRLPRNVLESVGVEVTAPVGYSLDAPGSLEGASLRGGYDVVFPATDVERHLACANIMQQTFHPWGECLGANQMARLRYLYDAAEAACAFRFPNAAVGGVPGLDVHATRMLPLPSEMAEKRAPAICLGVNHYLGLQQEINIGARDRLQHMYVVGQTGTGKTTLLKSMIYEDMLAGNGLAVIDPHGDLYNELLPLIPAARRDDVVLLDPEDTEYPVGLNLLECDDEEERYFAVRQMRAIMERLMSDQYQSQAGNFTGPAFYQHMQMNMLLAMSDARDPGTLLEFYNIFQSNTYWKRWCPLVWADGKLRRWVEEKLPNINYTQRHNDGSNWGEYLSSKFEDFVFDPKLRLLFGQKHSTIDFRRVMDERKILFVNLAKGKLTEANSRFLGMVLMAKIQAAAMGRVSIPVQERVPFYLYVDEFQSLATENFMVLLSEARKFGLGLILANQFVSQIKDERIAESIFGNVGTLLAFRVGHRDAEMLARTFRPFFDQHDLTNLPNWHACVRSTVAGQVVTPFSLCTRPVPEIDAPEFVAELREFSRGRYGTPRAEVEATIVQSYASRRKAIEELPLPPAVSVINGVSLDLLMEYARRIAWGTPELDHNKGRIIFHWDSTVSAQSQKITITPNMEGQIVGIRMPFLFKTPWKEGRERQFRRLLMCLANANYRSPAACYARDVNDGEIALFSNVVIHDNSLSFTQFECLLTQIKDLYEATFKEVQELVHATTEDEPATSD